MVKRKPEVAVVAAMAVVAAVTLCATRAPTIAPQEATIEPTAVATTKATQPAQVPNETTAPTTPTILLYDVPLDPSLQSHIIRVAGSYGIDPAIIFAMAYRESSYNPTSIGDHGEAFGLLQVQPKWHSARMARLGCSDLLDPYQNIIVGTDYLAEQMIRYGGDISKALVAYNAGHYKGVITRYAQEVLAKAEELGGTTYEAEKQGI